MSSTPPPPTVDRGETADASAVQRLNEWRLRLDAFADAFNAEISQILTTLADLPLGAPRILQVGAVRDVSPVPTGARTMEFTLPPASLPTALASQGPRPEPPNAALRRSASASASTSARGPAAPSPPVTAAQVTVQRPVSASQGSPQPPAATSEPNRLAALKARLSQQMESSGHSQPGAACSSEGKRS